MPRPSSSRIGPAVIRLGLLAFVTATATPVFAEDAEFVDQPKPPATAGQTLTPSSASKPSQGGAVEPSAPKPAPTPAPATAQAPEKNSGAPDGATAPKAAASSANRVNEDKPAIKNSANDKEKRPVEVAPQLKEPAKADVARRPEPQPLRVLSWDGAYGAAQKIGIFKTLSEDFDKPVKRIERSATGGGDGAADVVEVDQLALQKGCASGRYLKLGEIRLVPGANGETPAEDFVAGGLSPCGVATFAWSALFVVDDDGFKRRKPARLADIFDPRRYPGQRVFIDSAPHVVLLTALAAGIPADKLHDALLTQEGSDTVFKALESLREHIIWAQNSKQALEMLANKRAAIAMSFSGRLFRKMIAGQIRPIWDGHIYEFASWAVRADTRRPADAKAFIAEATTPQRLAAQARYFPYGPMRRSATALVGRHALVDIELEPYLPTAPERLKTGFQFDAAFWLDNKGYFDARLKAFREGFKNGIRVPAPVQTPKELRKQTELPTRKPVDG